MTPIRLRFGDVAAATLLTLLALALFSLDWRNGLYGGIAEVGARRVLAGDVPYRDFWTIYAPGQFYLLAGFLRLGEAVGFGARWLISPIAASTLLASACGVLFVAVRRAGASRAAALLAGSAIALAIASTPFHRTCGSYPPALLLLASAWALMATRGERASTRASLAAGLCLGAAALFKHDVAAYAAIGLALTTLARVRADGASWRAAPAAIRPLALGALGVFLPPMIV
ncbi:MAG: hypothetical protein JRH01_20650, partial [Deltaproteobacteria bacterium]|nr:hypothetical protein [Deltaproteobacteria bacterium]